MYSEPSDSAKADKLALEAGYEVEDWANNDLGTAVGWWTKNRKEEDEEETESAELRAELRKRATARGSDSNKLVAPLRTFGGALARAHRAADAGRVRDVIAGLGTCRVDGAALQAVKPTTKLLGSLRRSKLEGVGDAARDLVAKWKRILTREREEQARLAERRGRHDARGDPPDAEAAGA